MSNTARSRAWVDVDLAALRANYAVIRQLAGGAAAIIPMVKADAYGVGAERVVGALEALDPGAYGVATVDEGVALREFGVRRPIVVFGPLPEGDEGRAAGAGLTATISDADGLKRWARVGAQSGGVDFHVEIDTGMGRAGFDWRQTGEWSGPVRSLSGPRCRWAGVYTHFHSADVTDPSSARTQWTRFQDALAQLPVSREDLMVHAANSAAILRWPEYAADAVRPGIFLYGGRAVHAGVAGAAQPRPVVAVRARLIRVRKVPPGTTSGYGATYAARGWERWGTLAIGYGDGLPRTLANRGHALLHSHRVPIVGRISMDMTVVDITSVPDAEAGDVATVTGTDGENEIALDDVAERAGTISYEILTGLTARLPRLEC